MTLVRILNKSGRTNFKMIKDVTKRYLPVHGIGTFICANCIVESSKNFILDEFPEVIGIETHKEEANENTPYMADIALKCLIFMAKKFPPTVNMFFLDAEDLLNNSTPGTIFIGCSFDDMNNEESKPEFFQRVKNEILAMNIMRDKQDEDMDDEEKEHYKEMLEIGTLMDTYVAFSEKEDENDVDDHDI